MAIVPNELEELRGENRRLVERLSRLETAFAGMPQGVCLYEDNIVKLYNPAYERTIGVEQGALCEGMSGRDVTQAMIDAGRYPGQTADEVFEEIRIKFLEEGTDDIRLSRGEATYSMHSINLANGSKLACFQDISRHIAESERAGEALRESEERFRLAAEAAGLGIWDYDTASSMREWSERLKTIFGFETKIEPTLELALERVHPEDRPAFAQVLHLIRDDDSFIRFERSVRIIRANDSAQRWLTITGWKTAKDGCPIGRIIMTVRDVTEEKIAEERIKWSASHDTLTDLGNRAFFQSKLEEAIMQTKAGDCVGLLMLDIDHFKEINDSLGHDAGDELLKMFAKRLRGITRASDAICRLGGDEFAVILTGISTEAEVTGLANSILGRLREPFVHDGKIIDCRASIGAALCPEHGTSPRELMKHADIALYASKAAGRSISSVFRPAMKDDALKRDSMIQLARSALRDDRIIPFYQPKVDLRSGKVKGFEALLRWRSTQGRIMTPGSVSAAFADLDVANALSETMIRQVIADLRRWLDDGVDFGHVAVNASAAEFRKDDFAERVLEQLATAGVPTRHFELEVTETVFLGRGSENVQRALQLLSMEGVTIALDDFGTGYASLRHLKQFPVDTLKIDCSFVRDMLDDAGDEAIIRAVINLGRSLAITVVAEGIEQQTQAQHLVGLGCELGQGFLFSKAAPAAMVPELAGSKTLYPNIDQGPGANLRLVS